MLAALVPLGFLAIYMTDPAVRRASYWGDDWRDLPLAERVRALPEDALPSLRDELSDRRKASKVAPAGGAKYMQEDLRAVLADLPPAVQRLIKDRLIGVFLVENLGGHGEENQNVGLALEVSGLWRQHVGTVIFLDRDETDMKANKAMAGMEYVPDGEYRGVSVETRMARRDENDRRTTLRYVLLHELGHLIDYDRGITPWHFRYGDDTTDCGFTCLSWIRPDQHRFSRRIDAAMRRMREGDTTPMSGPCRIRFSSCRRPIFPASMPRPCPRRTSPRASPSMSTACCWVIHGALRSGSTARSRRGSIPASSTAAARARRPISTGCWRGPIHNCFDSPDGAQRSRDCEHPR